MAKHEELIKKASKLKDEADDLFSLFTSEESQLADLIMQYQKWYTESFYLIKQIIPERLPEFKEQYELSKKVHDINAFNSAIYTISDYLSGFTAMRNGKEVFNHKAAATVKFIRQMSILNSAEAILESSLADMEGVLQAELHDNEISKARDLLKNSYLRAAGVIAGVVLEGHLNNVCINNQIPIKKKNPSMSDYNEALKAESVIDVPTWRGIQVLGDLRNICAHRKERDPTKEEVLELIDGVDKSIKKIF